MSDHSVLLPKWFTHLTKDRMVTHILFDLFLFKHFSPVANFEQQSLVSPISNFFNESFFYISFSTGKLRKNLLWTYEIFFSNCSNWEKNRGQNWRNKLVKSFDESIFYRWMTLKACDVFFILFLITIIHLSTPFFPWHMPKCSVLWL